MGKWQRNKKWDRDNRILELRIRGRFLYEQIAKNVGCSKEIVQRVCVKSGAAYTAQEIEFVRKRFCNDQRLNEESVRERLEEMNPSFEYVGGYTSAHGKCEMRCKECGASLIRRYDNLVKGFCRCDNCYAEVLKESEQRKNERKAETAKRIFIRKAEIEERRQEAERIREEQKHPCAVCGRLTNRRTYCSNKCCHKANNHKSYQLRRAKIKNALVDKDITLHKLFDMESGRCYLCGHLCDWDDQEERDGTIICGDMYPSIDHVVPLSHGGKHEWDNVRLACRRCNYLKSDATPSALRPIKTREKENNHAKD